MNDKTCRFLDKSSFHLLIRNPYILIHFPSNSVTQNEKLTPSWTKNTRHCIEQVRPGADACPSEQSTDEEQLSSPRVDMARHRRRDAREDSARWGAWRCPALQREARGHRHSWPEVWFRPETANHQLERSQEGETLSKRKCRGERGQFEYFLLFWFLLNTKFPSNWFAKWLFLKFIGPRLSTEFFSILKVYEPLIVTLCVYTCSFFFLKSIL